MKYLPGFILIMFSIIFTGCFDILEDLSLNADGSGKYSITFDMDGIINDPMMKEMILESVKKDANLALGENEKIVIDSTVYMKDDPQFAKFKDNKALWETAKMHMVVNEETGKMFVNFGFDFDEVGDIDAFFKNLNDNSDSQNMFAGFDQIVSGSNFLFKKKSLTRMPATKSDDSIKDNFGEEDLAMLKMFMTDSNLKTTYSFPGAVKKSSIPNAVVNKNEVTVSIPLLDLMEGKAMMDGEIKFKN